MNANTLELGGIKAWLEDRKKGRFPLGPATVEGNTLSTVIELATKRSYHLHWCIVDPAKPLHARCEIFRPDNAQPQKKTTGSRKKAEPAVVRIANHHMSADDPQTQYRSTKGRLEAPLPRNWLLEATSEAGADDNFITLEIRRLKEAPNEITYPDKIHPGRTVHEVEMDYLSDDNPHTGKPFVVFRFDFKGAPSTSTKRQARSSGNSSAVPSVPPPGPLRRKRSPPGSERKCDCCHAGDSEALGCLVTCHDCGRSFHVPCEELPDSEVIRTYDWVCVNCKKCEICSEQGDNARMLLCDNCDRGWHMVCLNPPLQTVPATQKWLCPVCPNTVQSETSVASTSRSTGSGSGKGESRVVVARKPSLRSSSPQSDSASSKSASVRRKRQRTDANEGLPLPASSTSLEDNPELYAASDSDEVQIVEPNLKQQVTSLLKENDAMRKAREKLRKEKEAKNERYQKLVKELKTKNDLLAKQVSEEKRQMEAIDAEIEKLQVALQKEEEKSDAEH